VFYTEDGRKFIEDDDGKPVFVEKDANGKEFFVNAQGEKQLIKIDP